MTKLEWCLANAPDVMKGLPDSEIVKLMSSAYERFGRELCEEDENAIDLKTDDWEELHLLTSSKGNQRKWFNKSTDEYFKLQLDYDSHMWKDYMVERLSYLLSREGKLLDIDIIEQNIVRCNYGYGVKSMNFAPRSNQYFISYSRLTERSLGTDLSIMEIFNTILNDFKVLCNLDATNYLIVMFTLDYLLLNEDRHLNNFGVMFEGMEANIAPLFDFGIGLFEHDNYLIWDYPLDRVDRALMLPFYRPHYVVMETLVDNGYGDIIRKVLLELQDVDSVDFPSENAYTYFVNAKERLEDLCRFC